MKKCKMLFSLLSFLLMWPSMLWAANMGVPNWFGNSHFIINMADGLVKVNMNKKPWESFSVARANLVSEEGYLSLTLRANDHVLVRIDGFTADRKQINLVNEKVAPGTFKQVFHDMTGANANVEYLIFYVNPGQSFRGELSIHSQAAQPGMARSTGMAQSSSFNLYPNPVTEVMKVTLPHSDFSQLEVYDAQNNMVLSKAVTGTDVQIDLSTLPAGIYLVKATGSKDVLSSRLIVQ